MDNVGYRHLVLYRACSWLVLGLYLCKASYKLFMAQECLSTHTHLAMQLHTCTLRILLSVAVSDNINTRRDNRHTQTLPHSLISMYPVCMPHNTVEPLLS